MRRNANTLDPSAPLTGKDALKRLVSGRAAEGMRVRGRLELDHRVTELPAGLDVDTLDLRGALKLRALPPGLKVRRVDLGDGRHPEPERFLPGLHCRELSLRQARVETLPADLVVEQRLDLEECGQLVSLPPGLRVGVLNLARCVSLRSLPEGLETSFLDISGCVAIEGWPTRARVEVGRLRARGCRWITALPPWLGPLAQLDLRDCSNLVALPEGLRVSSWIDLAGTPITSLPASLRGVAFRWRGVPVEERMIFHPETITAGEVLGERNAERRRVLMERMGYDRFLECAQAETLDQDRDPGGERRLLRVNLEGDEPLVCLSVLCPSTARRYMIRVPPKTRTCRHAAAWIAGFNRPEEYAPLVET